MGVPVVMVKLLSGFVFQLGARRALDYAAFFRGRETHLAGAKECQAVLFGQCHTLVVRGDYRALVNVLRALAACAASVTNSSAAARATAAASFTTSTGTDLFFNPSPFSDQEQPGGARLLPQG